LGFCAVFYGIIAASTIKPEMFPSFTDGTLRILGGVSTLTFARYFSISQQSLFTEYQRRGGKKASLVGPTFASLLFLFVFCGVIAGPDVWREIKDSQTFDNAVALMQQKNYRAAEPLFKAYLAKHPDDVNVHLNLGLIYAMTDRIPQSKGELDKVLRVDPANPSALDVLQGIQADEDFEKAHALLRRKKYREAEPLFKAYVAQYPEERAAHFNLAVIYAQTNRLPQAKKEVQEYLRSDPGDQDAKDLLQGIEDDLKAQAR
jgi:tetratricopeptide (TPR) repeat protein